jgi:hypothetical protein
MTDIKLENSGTQWDLAMVDGDLVLFDEKDELGATVGQRVVYRLMPWLGESPYEIDAGMPHDEILGSLSGAEGIAGLYAIQIQETDGVAEVREFEFDEPAPPDYALQLRPVIRVENQDVSLLIGVGS